MTFEGTPDQISLFNLGIKIINITGNVVRFSEDVYQWYIDSEPISFIDNDIKAFEFDDLKARIGGKGLILGGDKDYKEYLYQKTFDGTEENYLALLIGYSEEQPLFFNVNSFGHPYFSLDETTYNAQITLSIEITDNVGDITLKKGSLWVPDPVDDETILTLTKH